MATVVLLILNATLSHDDFFRWAWRVAFWLSAVIVLVGWWIRRSVEDAPIFKEARAREEELVANRVGQDLAELDAADPRLVEVTA